MKALAIDLGGSRLRAAAIDRSGSILAEAGVATDVKGGPAAVLDQIETLTSAVRKQCADVRFEGVGIAACGPLDPATGIVLRPPTLQGWRDVPLAALVGDRLGLAVRLENDGNAAALGEWHYGAGRATRSMVFVTVSTGIGGGVIADGRLLHGRRGLAAEVGHMTIAAGTARCACGALGCWEALASGTALGRDAAELAASGAAPVIRLLAADGPVTSRHVVEAARGGDAPALALLAVEARWLGVGLANLLHLYSPEALVIGGGVMACFDLMQEAMERELRARAMPSYRDVPLMRAALGERAGLIGAASLVLRP